MSVLEVMNEEGTIAHTLTQKGIRRVQIQPLEEKTVEAAYFGTHKRGNQKIHLFSFKKEIYCSYQESAKEPFRAVRGEWYGTAQGPFDERGSRIPKYRLSE